MTSSAEQQMAAPVATAPGGGGTGRLDPQWRKAAVAALRGRMAAHRDGEAGYAALASARSLALQAFSRREQLKGLKDQLRGLQPQLAETLSALETLEASSNEDAAVWDKIEEAIFWYEKFLGFKFVVGEEGVKFVLNKLDPQSPEKEYSLCINFDKDRYNLLQCDPHIKDVEKLVKDLNLSDNVVKFVRIIREKFQSSAMNGALPISPVVEPDVSAPPFPSPMVTSVGGRSEDVLKQSLPAKRGATALSATSPGSLRRSSRAKGVR